MLRVDRPPGCQACLGLGGEQTLRPPEECDTEDDAKDIEIDDLNMTEVLKLAKSEGLDSTAVEACIRKEMKSLQDFGVYQEISEKDVKERGLRNARTLRKTICMCRHLEQR